MFISFFGSEVDAQSDGLDGSPLQAADEAALELQHLRLASPAPKAVAATPPKLETLPETLAVPTPGATPTAMPTASATPSGEATAPSTSLALVPVTTPEKASTPLAPLALEGALNAAASAKHQVVVKQTLPGPTGPLDSHPDNVRAYCERWNMTKTNKNGPEVMQQLQGQVASSTPAQPFAPPAQLAAPQPVVAPVHPAVPPAQPVAPPAQVALPEPAVAPPASAVGTMEELERLALTRGVGPKLPPVPAAQPDPGSAEPVTINWSTNKKEGMRLTRMMDSHRDSYPHMAKLWDGSKKDWLMLSILRC